jgi:hypothetical protein
VYVTLKHFRIVGVEIPIAVLVKMCVTEDLNLHFRVVLIFSISCLYLFIFIYLLVPGLKLCSYCGVLRHDTMLLSSKWILVAVYYHYLSKVRQYVHLTYQYPPVRLQDASVHQKTSNISYFIFLCCNIMQ